jgi:phage terminase large subunit-like protein
MGKSGEFSREHFEAWCKNLILDSGGHVQLEEFQQAFVEDVFAGRKVNWLVVPEGNGKTTLLAALGLYGLRFAEYASIPIAASTRDQVRIMYRQMKGFVTRSDLGKPDKGFWFECFDGYRQVHLRKTGRTKRGEVVGQIEVHAADAGTADGVIPFPFAFLDELHRHKNLALHRTWGGKLEKRGAQLIVISTAGEPGHDFEITREKIKTEAADVSKDGAFVRYSTDRVVLHEWAVRDDTSILDADAVKAANPLSSITVDLLEKKLADPTMTEAHWRRFTCNIATMDEGKDPFIDLTDWDQLVDPDFEISSEAAVCLGGDGSRTWDTTVIAWASANEEGVVSVDARVFSVREAIDCHVLHKGGKIDFEDVEAFIIDRFDVFNVSEVAYDPRYLERSMEIAERRLPDAAVYPVEPSSKHMRDALQTMFNLVSEGKLRHRGDKVLRQHIANTGVERGGGSELRRVRKVDSRLPIDAVPAMALAIWRAAHNEASIYEEREMVMI